MSCSCCSPEVDELLAHGAEILDGGVGIGEGEVEEGPVEGQRRSQLVGGVGDEAALGLEGGLESIEQPVDGVGQIFNLVARAGQGQPFVQVLLGDPSGSRWS